MLNSFIVRRFFVDTEFMITFLYNKKAMIKKIVLVLLLLPLFVKAQQNEDLVPTRSVYDSVEVSLKNDKDLYKKLLDRYIDIDTTLNWTQKDLLLEIQEFDEEDLFDNDLEN